MLKKVVILIALFMMVIVPSATAQEMDIPNIAIIRFGPLRPFMLSQKGTLDMLEAYGYLSAEERATLEEAGNVEGENAIISIGDAEFDFPTANLLVEDALDKGANVIIAITTPVSQAAVNATLDLENPPIVLFNTVTSPYAAGIAQKACIKPDYVTGSQALPPYDGIMPLLQVMNPDISVVGTIFNNAEANSVAAIEIMQEIATELGFTLEAQPVTASAEVGTAAEALVTKGVEAFLIPTDSTVTDGMPALLAVAEENGLAILHADASQVNAGATVAAGLSYYQEGVDTGRMLIYYLKGELDIATTGISLQPGMAIGINLDSAAAQGVELPQELLDMADFAIEGGASTEVDPVLPEMTMEDMEAGDVAFLDSLLCTQERIDEQQAELDAETE